MPKVSTIMPSYLDRYDGGAQDREFKFNRAVESWIKQSHNQRELIIVSDGCFKTKALYERYYSKMPDIKFIKIDKQELWSGQVRQSGLDIASGDIINYLDTDDYIQPSHISNIVTRMTEHEYDWCFFSDWLKINARLMHQRPVSPNVLGLIGVSNLAHKRSLDVKWSGCDGYGHDYIFAQRLKRASKNYEQIYGCGYVVCHTVNGVDN